MDAKWIYVSTDRQGQSGLGIEAQFRRRVSERRQLVKKFVEVESGKNTDRPMLSGLPFAPAADRELAL